MRSSIRFVPLLALVFGLVAPVAAQTPAAAYGAATPQEVVAGFGKAAAADDFGGAVKFVSPAGRREMSKEMVTGVSMMLALSDPNDPMPGSPKKSAKELADDKKKFASAVSLIKATLKPHGLDTILTMKPMSESTQKTLDTALDKTDTAALLGSMMAAIDKVGPLLGMKKDESKPKMPFTLGPVAGYKITGDKATAKSGAETIDFVKVDGRWYLTPPSEKGARK
jgi:hypothetical protein